MNTRRLYFGTLCIVGKEYSAKAGAQIGTFIPTNKYILMKQHFYYKGLFKNIRSKEKYIIDPYAEYNEKDICIDPNSVIEFNKVTKNKKKHLSKKKVFILYNEVITSGKI